MQARQVTPPQPNVNPYRRRPVKQTNWLPWLVVGGGVIIGGGLLLVMIVGLLAVYFSPQRLPQGIQIAGIPVGGETVAQAQSDLERQLSTFSVTLVDGTRQWSLPVQNLGLTPDVPTTLKAAQNAKAGAQIKPALQIDLNKTQTALVSLSEQVNIAAQTGQVGRAMDIPVILDRLRTDASGEISDGVLELNMFELPPLEPEPSSSYSGATTQYIVESGEELGLIAKEFNVSVEDIMTLNDISNPDLLYVGQELNIPAPGIFEPTAADAPAAPVSTGKSILVSISSQRIYAYENGQLVRSHLVSTGLPDTPTVLGDYSVYVKYQADDMSGPGYFLPQVPYTMYFYSGYAIHGTYWHNKFGRPMSHGCVNLPTDEAQWFFNWAQVGTPVRVVV